MHLKSVFLFLILLLLAPGLRLAAQNNDSAMAADSAMYRVYHDEMLRKMEMEKKRIHRKEEKMVMELEHRQKQRSMVIVLIAVVSLMFLAGIVVLIVWLVRRS